MADLKRVRNIVLFHVFLIAALLYVVSFFLPPPKEWTGVDEAVVEKIAADHGRPARRPVIDTDKGDLLLFLFLAAGAAGGFAAGYYWRELTGKRRGTDVS